MNRSRITLQMLFVSTCFLLGFSACTPAPTPPPASTSTPSQTSTITLTSTEAPTQTPWVITSAPLPSATVPPQSRKLVFLSLVDGNFAHLFAYSPLDLPLTRLTNDPWNAITPAIGPDGNWLAFSSRQNGFWDIHLLDLQTGGLLRLTDTPAYDAYPTWSPDGAYLAYETSGQTSLEIVIRSVTDPTAPVILLTNDVFLDSSPGWSPLGRQITFVSNRSGEPEIWIADLDRASSDQFINLSRSPDTIESHPVWSPDGTRLAWSSYDPLVGFSQIVVWNALQPSLAPRVVATGDWPAWQDDSHLLTLFSTPSQPQLVGISAESGNISLPPMLLPGDLQGLTIGSTSVSLPGVFLATSLITPDPLYIPQVNPSPDTLPGRTNLVTISGIQAPYPQLSDQADEAFTALRLRVATLTGWDALASLENAFVPLSISLDPGLQQDWLYTGRAITLGPALVQAGWMVVVREDFGLQTWWRVYLRTLAQDGSMGRPLTTPPWDFSTRNASSQAYEAGGSLMDSIPGGYWLDLTSLASAYGWERLPALLNWRTYYAGARFNEFAYIQGTNWLSAMLELYPREALLTPTVVIPPTRTATRTPLYYRSPTPTRTPTTRPTLTP